MLFAPPVEHPAGAITVTVALADLVASAALVAVTVCVPAVPGAVYKPLVETVPTVLLPPAVPSTDHVTDVFVDPAGLLYCTDYNAGLYIVEYKG